MVKVLKKIALYKLVLLSVLALSLLLSYIPEQAWQPADAESSSNNLHVLEFADDGSMLDPAQWQALQTRITNSSRPPELLLFIHGWHHSAKPDDDNFVAFQSFYQKMAASDPDRNLIGVYIGWRGDKYDPFWLDGSTDADSWIEPLDFPTIIQRKWVARHIGQTGFKQLLDQLDSFQAQQQLQRYTVIGHSLGGVVALHGSKDRVRDSILQHKVNPNLFILLNPAATTAEYQPLDQLLSVNRQKPAMVVLQSKGDFALKEAFNWIKDGERAMGNSWAITHDIDRCPRGDCSIPLKMPKALQEHDAKPGCMMTLDKSGWKVRARLQARRTVQTCGDANMQAVWVLAVSDDIIYGHNGILTDEHARALSEVMAKIDLYDNQIPLEHARQSADTLLEAAAQQPTSDTSTPAADTQPETTDASQETEPAREPETTAQGQQAKPASNPTEPPVVTKPAVESEL